MWVSTSKSFIRMEVDIDEEKKVQPRGFAIHLYHFITTVTNNS